MSEILKKKGYSEERIAELAASFQLFDFDGTGSINTENLESVLNRFDRAFSQEDLQFMLRSSSHDGKCPVSLESFAQTLNDQMQDPMQVQEAMGATFDLFDINKKGSFDKQSLIATLELIGEKITDDEAEEMLKVVKDRDSFIQTMSQSIEEATADCVAPTQVSGDDGSAGMGMGMGGGMPAPAMGGGPSRMPPPLARGGGARMPPPLARGGGGARMPPPLARGGGPARLPPPLARGGPRGATNARLPPPLARGGPRGFRPPPPL
eukprot:TRINITY_DN1348_c0_g1_i2.p2 TRINITY_DN1348_c0_g1~~TRINITY_DN1348_c0_g1_i2.p2  ORF type:complete len:265 (-),score=82.57 TRINITY_DN1348_c0_g1_i2:1374-2168(-)